ncbi:hypothetical protein G3M81_03950 [Bacillus paralicheniformis]|uniref:restriction endonuclease subunit S n=1 Tax=Bacillus paralicheniformis TaxID=1648923 RepID=UPI0013EEEBE6|nr:restriction endonuclease subunit S [Bacillus paralicheniformis]QII47945.1 hypothetical protein G3M81_03950 [Bacillus paralicheniformis]
MKELKIQDLFQISKGKKVEQVANDSKDKIRYIQIEDLRNNETIKYCKNDNKYIYASKDDIIIAWDGANAGTIGYNIEGVIGSTLAVLKRKNNNFAFNTAYVAKFMQSKTRFLRDNCTGATIPHISRKVLENLNVPLPSMDVQNKIVILLDKVQSLIDKRKAQITTLSDLTHSVFLEMFGDPSSNKYNFNKVKIGDVIYTLEAGLSTGGENRKKEAGEYGVLTTSAVTYGEFRPESYKVPTKNINDSKKIIHPTKNSILVSRMNTTELVGASCIVEDDYYDLFIPDRLWKLTLKTHIVNPYYFVSAIQHKYFRKKLSQEATGTSGSMLNISQSKFKKMELILPSLEQQNKFVSILNEISINKKLLVKSLTKLENNLNSLMHQAFKGELFND